MTDNVIWHDLTTLNIEGKGWTDTRGFYDRLPARAEKIVRDPVWNLSRDSAGICARFTSDATAIHARWSLRKESLAMVHMPATGVSGVDLYARVGYAWRWLGIGRPATFPDNEVLLCTGLPEGTREYMLYLPLYNGVRSVSLGVPESTSFEATPPRRTQPIVFYGTSITQGGCASRPGTCHPAVLGRMLDRTTINLGFSGNGKMEKEIAELLAELDPALYVIDCLPNMTADEVAERAPEMIRILRAARPETPILLVEDRTYSDAFLHQDRAERNRSSRAALRQVFSELQDMNDLHYMEGDQLLGADGDDTVDGSHPTDLGFRRQAEAFFPVLKKRLTP